MFQMPPDKVNNMHTCVPMHSHTKGQSVLLSLLLPVSLHTQRADFDSRPIKWWMTLCNILPCLLSGSESCRSAFWWQKFVTETLWTSKKLYSCSCMSRWNGDGCKQQTDTLLSCWHWRVAPESDSVSEKCTVQGWTICIGGFWGTWTPLDFANEQS